MVDVVIVGAGAAGLAAASALLRAKKRPLIVEASHRIGGRAYTDRSAFGLPFDRGCKWLHSASRNPWTKIADELGYDYLEGAADILVWSGRRFEDEQSKAKLFSYVQACWEAAERAAGKGQDRPLSEVMPKGSVLEERFFEHWCTVINGVPTKQTSTLDQARFVDTEENWPVVQGYGALIHTYGRALPVHLGVRVEAVHHKGRSVEVHTNRGN